MRPGAWLPFPAAAALLGALTGTALSEPSVRRKTEEAGATSVALQTAAAERLEREGEAAALSRTAWRRAA